MSERPPRPMTLRALARRSLHFHWRSHLGVVLGAAIGSAALIGALVVGDSVKGSLREQALERLARAAFALNSGDRFFCSDLTERLGVVGSNRLVFAASRGTTNSEVIWGNFAPQAWAILQLPANVSRADGAARANHVQLLGVSDAELEYARSGRPVSRLDKGEPAPHGEVWINDDLSRQLSLKPGEELLFRIQKPSALSTEAAINARDDSTTVARLRVAGISQNPISKLNLASRQTAPMNVLISRSELGRLLDLDERANLLLAAHAYRYRPQTAWESFWSEFWFWKYHDGANPFTNPSWRSKRGIKGVPADSKETIQAIDSVMTQVWTLQDVQHELTSHRESPAGQNNFIELKTRRIFLDPPIVRSALAPDTVNQPLLTYLATLLRSGTNATPYSMVTAAESPWTPVDLRDNEIVVSQWLAEDLQVKPGDEIALSYFLPESGARLEEATNTFRVHSIVPMEMPWADPTLMPDFPGIKNTDSTRDWDAGFPLVYKIRAKDDEYWEQHRGTPKAFITLAAGQKMWGNRFGNLTAIRFPIPTNLTENGRAGSPLPAAATNAIDGAHEVTRPTTAEEYRAVLEKKILANLKPEELGLRFEPVAEQALKAAEESQDFGGLFLGFSFFLIIAALLLMALLFRLGIEQRAPEIGTLLALGFTPKQVRGLLLREGVMLAFIGGVIGVAGGICFAKVMLHGLTTVWRDAVGATTLTFHMTAQTLVIGLLAGVIVSSVTLWIALRQFVKREPRQLLVGDTGEESSAVRNQKTKIVAIAALACAFGLVGWALVSGDVANAGIFFGAGALALVAGLFFASARLARLDGASETGAPVSLASIAVRSCARRRKRSLATIAMLACGSFLITSIGVFRLDANRDASEKTSGTGGFAFIGETTMPVVHDLNSRSGREFFALNDADMEGVNVVPFRVRAGDEASCLNLNASLKPRLLGVKPEMLMERFGFAKGEGWAALLEDGRWKMEDGKENHRANDNLPSSILHPPSSRSEIPAIGDANSIQWAMKKKVGDTIDYVDERGQPFKVRIVGAVANSILQGQLIIDEAEFVKRFPGESGHRMFLLDAPSNRVVEVSMTLSRAMQDVGLELTPAPQRLAQFNAVQNTYLGTFQVLGGLGLLLGSVGLGVVVLRNVLERRSELAVLLALGFRKAQVQRLLLVENGALLLTGLAIGVAAAAIAVLPAVMSPGGGLPVASLSLTLGAVLLNGALWTWAATRLAVRGDLLKALRND